MRCLETVLNSIYKLHFLNTYVSYFSHFGDKRHDRSILTNNEFIPVTVSRDTVRPGGESMVTGTGDSQSHCVLSQEAERGG